MAVLKIDKKNIEIKHFEKLLREENTYSWMNKTLAGQQRKDIRLDLIMQFVGSSQDSRNLLELGCAGGEFTRRLAKLSDRIVAVDLSYELIKMARNSIGSKNVNFVVADIDNLPFKDETFDIIVGNSILHHLELMPVLKQIRRFLNREGKLWFSEPNLFNPQVFLSLKIGFLRKRLGISPNETAFLRWRIKGLFHQGGFKDVRVSTFDFLHPCTPNRFIPLVKRIGKFLEGIPLLREISGSIMIEARK